MKDEVLQERDVCFDPSNSELTERSICALDRFVQCRAPYRHFDQQGIKVWGDNRPGESVSSIQSNREAAGRSRGGQPPVVGDKLMLRILGRDSALERDTAGGDLWLCGHPHRVAMEWVALGDQDLTADQVDTCDYFRHGVLNLNSWANLEEAVLLTVDIDEKLDRPRRLV